jgi:hypothetical protein
MSDAYTTRERAHRLWKVVFGKLELVMYKLFVKGRL